MKRLNLYISAFSMLFSLSVLTACDEEENLFGNRDTSEGMYELSVTATGFVPGDASQGGETGNIAVSFENDDAVGLVMVDGEKVTHTRYMYKHLLGKWSGDLTVKNPEAKIFAYYPYDAKLDLSTLNTQGTNASEFFAQLVANFAPQADQSTEENFKKSNLMIGMASLDEAKKSLSITLDPAMALAMVKVDPSQGGTMYLESDLNYTWEVEGVSTENLAPFYTFAENTFVSYVKPETEQTVSTASGRIVVTSIAKGTYQECDMSLVHVLQAGDFYMNDGSIVGKDAALTEEQKAKCIGIVFQTDVNRIGEVEKATLESKGTQPHGLVLSLKNVKNNQALPFSVGKVDVEGITNSGTLQECYEDINGLAHTQAIYSIDPVGNLYPVFTAVKEFNSTYYRPDEKTTEWFLPSIGQFWDALINLGGAPIKETTTGFQDKGDGYFYWRINSNKVFDKINTILGKANSDLLGLGNSYEELWVAGEPVVDAWKNARKVLFNNGDLHFNMADKKEKIYKARPILAF